MLNARLPFGVAMLALTAAPACTNNTNHGRDATPDHAGTPCKPNPAQVDLSCNDDPNLPTMAGICQSDGTCACVLGFVLNPATRRCKAASSTDAGAGVAPDGPVCTFIVDRTCDDDPAGSGTAGVCMKSGACACNSGFSINPATGRCRAGTAPDARSVDDSPALTDGGLAAMPDAPDDTKPATVADGGSTGITSRVLIVDPTADRFLAYDRNGQVVHDYRQPFTMGDGYDGRTVLAESPFLVQLATAGSYNDPSRQSALVSAAPGLAEPLRSSHMVVRAKSTLGLETKVKIVATDGTVTRDLNLSGDWPEVRLSPSRKFLYAAQPTAGGNYCAGFSDMKVILVRLADAATIWQGSVCTAAFARDDSYFVFSARSCDNGASIVNLVDGKVTQVPPLFPCPTGTGPATLKGATTLGAVLISDALSSTSGYRLWFVDWQGKATALNPAPTAGNTEYFYRFNPQGSAVLWGNPQSEFDFSTLTNRAPSGLNYECFGEPTASFAKTTGQSLNYCRCSDGACATIATLPQVEDGWADYLKLSPDRRFIFITYSWGLGRLPTTTPASLLYRHTGELLVTFPAVSQVDVMFDQSGQLAVLHSWGSNTTSLSLVNLANGQTKDLPLSSYGILYE